ncbi:uncharacterized protein LOC122304055 [Carya illinoinensis]|uniref:Uncharacterized protein n=1 Tax=Carya illinoinensis TaxID=32201 RepID=A0A8T1R600_CARIL|nr:uncharacterized protein LOC122304055 [Carya illinoinensis]XP_042972024.1 uncharacterized protein LOC122304055 [Carya illinoinensis]XP_042972026.1 uncharacterized protein LOC122304055 [Carya illinoinensis]KAG6661560.1 hypothetical protein CIPAW_03G182600 [Carya illinoinensis]KAG6661561.1 hypothetical protein CIPAW_03G182600 [Carya illinoinensis]
MDVKALAKSKRAHAQHHSRRPHAPHTNQKPKASSDGTNSAASAKKPLGKQVGEKTPPQPRGVSKLPSNWDRYKEELDPSASDGKSQPSDVILPKSKGADYGHLLAEAQAQQSFYVDVFPSLDDVIPGEFNQGLGAMLSVRGEGILSLVGDNNFVVEDETVATHEASFLSLDLHALAAKLENIDLSQRLFIEEDLLPSELCTEGLKTSSSQESNQIETCYAEPATAISEEVLDKVKIAGQNTEHTSFATSGSSKADQRLSSQGLVSVSAINVDPRQIGKSSQNKKPESTEQFDANSVWETQTKLSSFAAEEELDMLLDSFSETKKIVNPSGFRSNDSSPVLQQEASMAPFRPLSKPDRDSSKPSPFIATLDDSLDDLLKETSNVMSQNVLPQSLEGKADLYAVQSSTSHSGTMSKVLDEFDSWLDTI